MQPGHFDDKAFYATLFRVAVPIATQQLFMNALNAVDVLMVGQLGDTSVAAVGLANQVFFLMSLFLFGVGSGSGIFSAQFWGRGDVPNLRRVLGLALMLGIGGSALFSLAAVLAPRGVLGFYTNDPAVIAEGSRYLRIVGLCYVPTAITTMYGMILRSTRNVKVPMAVSVCALSLKTTLAYLLIFGHLGFPELGVIGTAIATLAARLVECAAILTITYSRKLPAAASPRELLSVNRPLLSRFARTSLPVVLGEILWSFGITAYTSVYAHIGTGSVAAINIATTIESVALVPFMGMGNACAIIIGNRIGSGDTHSAGDYARRFLMLAILGALGVGTLIFLGARPLLTLYQITDEARKLAQGVLTVMAAALWLKSANLMMIVGIMRSGGDTRFALFADTAPLWCFGLPVAMLGAFVLHLPVYWVFAMVVLSDELSRFCLCVWRVLSGRWVNNVVAAI